MLSEGTSKDAFVWVVLFRLWPSEMGSLEFSRAADESNPVFFWVGCLGCFVGDE